MKSKFIYLIALVGTFQLSCSVDTVEETYDSEVRALNLEQDLGCAGADNSIEITLEEANKIPGIDVLKNKYLDLLSTGVSKEGVFHPSIYSIAKEFQKNPIGSFSTTYTISDNDCHDSVLLNITVLDPNQEDPCKSFDAGEDSIKTISFTESKNISGVNQLRQLFLNMLGEEILKDGVFTPSMWSLINDYQSEPIGQFTTEYTISDGECTDSVNLTLEVVPDPDPCSDFTAGEDKTLVRTQTQMSKITGVDVVKTMYLNLLDSEVPRNGVFKPTIWTLIQNYRKNPLGDFTTIYSVNNGDCEDSTELTLRVIAD